MLTLSALRRRAGDHLGEGVTGQIDGGGAFAEGHLGIRALSGLASDAGGTLKVSSMPAGGTCLRLEVPLR